MPLTIRFSVTIHGALTIQMNTLVTVTSSCFWMENPGSCSLQDVCDTGGLLGRLQQPAVALPWPRA